MSKSVQTKFLTHSDMKKNPTQSTTYDSQSSNQIDHTKKFSKSTSSRTFKTNNQQWFSTPHSFSQKPTNF